MKKIRLWKNRNELSDEYTIVDDEDYDKVVEALGKRAKWYLWKSQHVRREQYHVQEMQWWIGKRLLLAAGS